MNINLPASPPSTTRISPELITVFVTIFKSKHVSFVLFDNTKKNTTQHNIRIWPYIKIIIIKGPRFNFYWMTVLRGLIAWTLCSTLTPHSIDLRNFYGCQLSPFFFFGCCLVCSEKIRGSAGSGHRNVIQPTDSRSSLFAFWWVYLHIFFSSFSFWSVRVYIYTYYIYYVWRSFVVWKKKKKNKKCLSTFKLRSIAPFTSYSSVLDESPTICDEFAEMFCFVWSWSISRPSVEAKKRFGSSGGGSNCLLTFQWTFI